MRWRFALSLVAVLALALALRAFRIDEVPPGFYVDESSTGANARALLETGRDLAGERFPILIRSLEDWKHPLYTWTVVASQALLGPTRTSVRAPAAVLGTLAVLLVALLARELGRDARTACFAALVLAVTPWHVHYSRLGWESGTLAFTALLALWLYHRARNRGGLARWALAGAAFGLAVYSYTPAKLLVPALIATLLAIEVKEARWANAIADRVRKHHDSMPAPPVQLAPIELNVPRPPVGRRDGVALAVAFALVVAPFVVFQALHFAEIQQRFDSVSVFRTDEPLAAIARSYAAHLSPRFLLVAGDENVRHAWSGPGWAELLLVTAPLVVLGLVRAVARREAPELLLLGWLAIYPLGGAFTAEGVPHASRAILGVPLFALLAADGLSLVLERIPHERGRAATTFLAGVLLLANASLAFRAYFLEYPVRTAPAWNAGVEELVHALEARRGEIERVHFAPRVGLLRDDVVFFGKFDPAHPLDPYYAWVTSENLGRFLAALPRSEVLVARPTQVLGLAPAFEVTDRAGFNRWCVYRGLGKS